MPEDFTRQWGTPHLMIRLPVSLVAFIKVEHASNNMNFWK